MFTIMRRNFCRSWNSRSLKEISNKTYRNFPKCALNTVLASSLQPDLQLQTVRYKSKKSKKKDVEGSKTETETEANASGDELDKYSKVLQIVVKSLRVDGILKSGLGIARNKIETLFYESKIRVNGKKLLKKSDLAQVGDEIDVIKGPSVTNPNFLTVARVEIMSISEKGENLGVKIRRSKSLTIEDYDKSTT